MLEAAVTEIEHESALFFCEAFAEAEASKARSAFPVGKHKMISLAPLYIGLRRSNASGRVQGAALYWQKESLLVAPCLRSCAALTARRMVYCTLFSKCTEGKEYPPCAKTTHKGIFTDGVTRKYSLTLSVKKYIVVDERR